MRESRQERMVEVAAVGSLNLDLVVGVPGLPGPGETVVGGSLARHPGGKGANQAVAAARLGRRVAMIGCVGADDAGRELRASLAAAGVDASLVREIAGAPSGTALIAIGPDGENQVVVAPGANGHADADMVHAAEPVLSGASVTLLQLEIPIEAVRAASNVSARGGGTVLLNPAPAQSLPTSLLADVDVLIPNRGELAGTELPGSMEETADVAAELGVRSVVVTLGPDGALLVDGGAAIHVPAPRIDAVDTTAAGDAFCGALADALARRETLETAVRWAVMAGAAACMREGAQPSLPTRDEIAAMSTRF